MLSFKQIKKNEKKNQMVIPKMPVIEEAEIPVVAEVEKTRLPEVEKTLLPEVQKTMLAETNVTIRGDDKVSQFHHADTFLLFFQVPRSFH